MYEIIVDLVANQQPWVNVEYLSLASPTSDLILEFMLRNYTNFGPIVHTYSLLLWSLVSLCVCV